VCQMFSGVRHTLKLEVCISGLLCEIRQTEVQVHGSLSDRMLPVYMEFIWVYFLRACIHI